MKKRWGVIVFYLFIVISLISCDLFTGPKVDLFQIISDEVDWANAARLTVTVEFPLEWGSSPQRGEGKCGDTRKGYEFGVEFTPMSSYGFEKWLAVPTSAYAALDKTKSASEIESDGDTLNNVVTITESVSDTGAKTAKVKINTTEPVTLVPWCSERPKITMSNPPLINTGVSYNRGQQIKIWFSTDLQADTVKFAQDFITITGIKTDGTGEPYNENGENGDLAVFYNTPIYEISTRTITIMPSDPPPPGELMITVTVGTGVWGSNGNGMVSAVSFAYRTNAMMSRNSYNAENVWAIHKPLDAPAAEKFFYREAPTNRDRRLVKNGDGKYEVTVYFGVSRSGEVSEPTPDRLKIAEVYYANLAGGESNSLTKETAAVFANADGGSGADYIYRQGKTTTLSYYKTTYVWETPPEPGIIRLVLMPWRETIESVDPDSWRNAVAEGRFVDVVLDNQPPGGNASLTLGGQASVTNGVYNFNSTNNTLNVTGDFTGIADNAGFGIRHIAASMDKPWTMDEQSTLQWCYRIIDEGANPTSTESEWYDLDSATRTQNLTSLTSSTINRNIQVKYRDSLGNESEWSSSMGKIRYYNSARDVWAIHSATTSSVATDFFYQGADLARDRRLKGSSSTSNQVTLFFYIPGTGSTMPDKVRIAEINYAALNGNDKNELVRERDFTPTKFTSGTGANSVYMSGKPAASAATYYSVDYTWTSTYPATAGIIRLAVMPYSGTFNSNADSWQTAVEEGRFVTVVFDNLPPGGTANFSLSGESWRNGNVYTYNPASKSLTITPNLSGITDNSGVGIPLEAATQNKPWTMDNWANLQWQYCIVNEGAPSVALIMSGWYSFSTDGTAVTRDLSAATALAYSSLVRDIQVHYRDKTNTTTTTTTTSAWSSSVGKIRYNNSAGNVWAIHTGVTATGEANFFYQGAPTDRDRRLKKNGSNYEVIIYFSIPSTTTLPDRLRIAEINYATLNGNENTLNDTSIKTRDYTSLTQASGTSGTDYYYKQNVATGMTYYKVTYTGTTSYLTTPGIIRLAVMPYRTGETFTDTWQTAVEEGRFVTVVIDNLAPGGGSASITTSGEVLKTTDNVPVYNSNSKIVTVNASLLGVTDNNGSSGIIGIPKDTATQNKPWTMDNQENISWRFGIFTAGSSATPLITSDYKLLNATDPLTITRDLSAATALGNSTATREIRLQYKDSIGNESAWASSSIVGKLIYNTATFGDTVSTWTATYNESGNSISLTWTRPTNATIQVWVNGVLHGSGTTATAASPYRISNIPHIIDSGVRSGQAVSNVMEYNISLNPIYSNGTATPTTFKIWNIPDPTTTSKGMTVSNSNQAVELTQNNFTNTTLTDNLSKILVLTGDVNVSAWTPPSSNFTGKFYGNGHTITINGISGTATNSGLFGVANNALIRDLTVEYADMSLSGATSTTYVGGITGQAFGSTQILNCIVRGASTTNKLTVTANAQTYMGGVVSYMGGNSFIQNCRAALNVTLSNGSSNNVLYVGGVVGYSQSTGTSEKITSLGTVSMEKTNGESGSNYCGGIAGFLQYTKFTDCVFSGQISLSNFNASGTTYIGGVMGYYSTSGTADNCSATGNIMVNYAGSGAVYLGGIAGVLQGNSASNIVYFKNSTFKDGAISLETTGTSNCYVGGFSGAIYNYTDIKYCHSKALSVTAWSTGTSTNAIMAGGGFSGLMRQASISDCSSSSPVTIPSLHTSPCGVLAGGFTAAFENAGVKSSMTRCYATGDLIVYCGYNGATTRGSGNYIGGLVGFSYNTSSTATSPNTINQCYAAGKITAVNNTKSSNMYFGVGGLVGGAEYTDISECYATGSVTARKGQNVQTPVVVGGLVGFLGGGYSSSDHSYNAPLSSITDCYALGDVTADNPNNGGSGINGDVYAGGLVGFVLIDASKTITRSFAGGNVTAKNNNTITYNNTYAGGVIGYMATGGLNNTAHIGRNRSGNLVIIITQGGSNSSAGRIYAQSGEATPSGNYAYEGLFVGTNSSYYLYQTTAEVLDRIAPTMDLSPHVSNTLNNAYIVFGAGTIRDSGGSGLALASTTITVVSNPTGMFLGGSPTFNSSYNDMNNIGRIENIDLSGLGTTTTNYLQLNITIKDNAGNTANYLIQVNPNTSGSAFPFNFTCTFKPQGSTIANEPKHGTNITNVQLSDSTFWTDTLLFNSATGGGNTSAWNFAPIAQGWPVLANAGGQQ